MGVDLEALDAAYAATKNQICSQHTRILNYKEFSAAIHTAYPALAEELRALRMENIHLIQFEAGRQPVLVTRLSDGTM